MAVATGSAKTMDTRGMARAALSPLTRGQYLEQDAGRT
eukprot:CAMPEP_0183292264 /NCGR_PEP_ID=MMETSP0160_2-20130417/1382_1 /TAXON_ID=2839 ORGANISM="Odontella Sinensis, Strain Grunow 1884" /NCGR_SAMPLE_ID=MMETSP0160_2 /ASSEMBLY_ACC=CAM_ASM_000250 /LENGTH=37 /DNA_ID= /DNA_START= /DNA_END= /DNA_ORIENTATION=